MRKPFLLLFAVVPLLFSCASSAPPVAYHNTDNSALIVRSLDAQSCAVLAPTAMERVDNARLLDEAKTFAQHQTAVVILENYSEPQLGTEFRERSVGWFIGLRGLGYQHIYFLRGSGVNSPDGLPLLAGYD